MHNWHFFNIFAFIGISLGKRLYCKAICGADRQHKQDIKIRFDGGTAQRQ